MDDYKHWSNFRDVIYEWFQGALPNEKGEKKYFEVQMRLKNNLKTGTFINDVTQSWV